MNKIEIPFGAKDSELCGWEYTIPEGMEAVIKDGKVIVRRKESGDERIREAIESIIRVYEKTQGGWIAGYDMDTLIVHLREAFDCLEKQKEQPMSAEEVLIRAGLKPYRDGNQWCVLAGGDIQEGICGFGDTIDEALYQFLMEVLKIQKEQKPAEWSAEDEKMRNKIIGLLSGFLYPNSLYGEDAIECIDWLKSLRPSKDCSDCAKHLEGYISGRCDAENKLLEQFGALITPEDELHIKPRWKPSEEQMEALKEAVYQLDSSEYSSGIDSLYNDLKNYFKI